MTQRQVTLAEVARQASVSLATASRVLNGSTRQVSTELRDRVLSTARSLGYLPNASAQALARNSSVLVGLVVHDIADPYFSSIAAGVTKVAEENGLIVVLGTTNRDPGRELALLSTLRAHRARAIVLAGTRTTDRNTTAQLAAEVQAFTAQGGRLACVSQARLPADTVIPANKLGATKLARALVEQGHRRFAVLAGPAELVSARDRLAGFRAGLAESGIELAADAVLHGGFTRDGGFAAAQQLLTGKTGATCVFAVNDVMALGAMAAFRQAGLTVPNDISVAGFDDIPTLSDLVPSLTTVRLPLEEMGERAARLALDEQPPPQTRSIRINGEVVLRDSTAPPR
ncbi:MULTISPECIES: LacI family DNA-binding transcriptional regulator [unclassified Crossiella]|uniref:LacI family DNA-binding transcriptional regulator n=1 Tax=unclassified Crossiella TaxID=2620835 RepID=UPI001FFEB497|nr:MULTISPECIES: LacI family DNA-binding transcriptional regulator [unclassified Crossiella]MCK2242055.1 LacI family transcriptional regulator [Crossiella sp. S99.2]MCK2255958.1 LacI family transcriptional regulator [Crossiella sp. S99.1]